jgi:sulfoxide reductase heme-binding subunit YedZ
MIKPLTFFLGLVPIGLSVFQVYLLQSGGNHSLGADPGKELVLHQGEWAIRFLILALLVSPLRQLTGWSQLQRVRRMLGLFAFFYATLHLSAYLVFLLELDFVNLWADVVKRPYITVGFSAYVLLIPLAITSMDWMVRRLKRRWIQLHRAIYFIAILAVVHVTWLAKSSYAEAAAYGFIIAILLLARVFKTQIGMVRQGLQKPA